MSFIFSQNSFLFSALASSPLPACFFSFSSRPLISLMVFVMISSSFLIPSSTTEIFCIHFAKSLVTELALAVSSTPLNCLTIASSSCSASLISTVKSAILSSILFICAFKSLALSFLIVLFYPAIQLTCSLLRQSSYQMLY